MAGVVGFEPTVHDTKNRCLTTWLHPSMPFFYKLSFFCAREKVCLALRLALPFRFFLNIRLVDTVDSVDKEFC